jgi:hypothetical protein
MGEQVNQEVLLQWHRQFAATSNNTAWELASRDDRGPDENHHMLSAAFAAAYHWARVGTELNNARADVTLAHVLSLVDQGELALHYARRCLEFCENNPCEDWDLAFAHAEMAHAAAKVGEHALHSFHYARAHELGQAIAEEEDRQVFLDEFVKIPKVVEGS